MEDFRALFSSDLINCYTDNSHAGLLYLARRLFLHPQIKNAGLGYHVYTVSAFSSLIIIYSLIASFQTVGLSGLGFFLGGLCVFVCLWFFSYLSVCFFKKKIY